MIVVHHLNNSRSQRVLWMLEELELPYEVRRYERLPSFQAPPELKAVHPLGKSPVLQDGAVVVAESGAILEYLVETYGRGRLGPPADPEGRNRYRYFMHYAEGSLMPVLLLRLLFGNLPRRVPWLMRPVTRMIAGGVEAGLIRPQIAQHFGFLEAELKDRDWFAGPDLTACDVQMSFPLYAAAARGALDDRMPRLAAFVKRVEARPAWQRAIERGGPFEILR
ncbi:MAG: glutathione S-transferase [Alphaproteobacteria bacterium]|nr:glutathione S-transferase [Alphaproteobacteria bacterium]